ncbi:MAG: hypothetical protein MZU91_10575 [Desulfosudis oleivorans]|nr:hypothetical protein [Desulfosudis oleivorans]
MAEQVLGPLWGARLVKAICFKGNAEIAVKDKKRFMKVAKKLRDRIMSSDSFGYTRTIRLHGRFRCL